MVNNLQFKPNNDENNHLDTFISVFNATCLPLFLYLRKKLKINHYKLLHVSAILGHLQATVELVKVATLYFNLIKTNYLLCLNI
jgi:hypothetical protein